MPLLKVKSGTFAFQNGHFRNAKRALLKCETGMFQN